jgi:MFS family permease
MSNQEDFHTDVLRINAVESLIKNSNLEAPYQTNLSEQPASIRYHFKYFYPVCLTINACLCAIYVGYNLGVLDTMDENLKVLFAWDEEDKDIYLSVISSSVLLGAVLGSLFSGIILSKFGRRRAFFIYNINAIIGMVLSVILNEYILISGRVLVGFSAGSFSSLVPIYLNENVPYEISGACGVVYEMSYALGICISYLMGLGLPEPSEQTLDNRYWSVMLLFPIGLILINTLFLIFYFKHDTPKYLILKKRTKEAIMVLKEIYTNESEIILFIENIQKLEENKGDGSVSYRQLFSKTYRKRFLIGIISCWGQQANGIDILIFYSNKIFYKNVDHFQATILTNMLGFVLFFANVLTIFVIERFGRRKLLLIGNIISFLSLTSICVLYFFDIFLPIIILFILFVFITGLAVAPVSYVYCADILPEKGMGIAVMTNYISTIIVIQCFPFLMKSFLQIQGSMSVFAFFNLILIFFILFFFKETRGKSPKEIEYLFR